MTKKKVTITINPKRHILDPVESLIEETARALMSRTKAGLMRYSMRLADARNLPIAGEIKKAGVEDWGAPTFAEISSLVDLILKKDALAQNTAASAFGFGVEMAKLGELVLQQAPTQDQVKALLSSPGFVDREAVKFAQSYMFHGIKSKEQKLIAEFQGRLIESLKRRESPVSLARTMAAELDEDWGGWLTIARTETARSLNEGLFEETARLGKEYVYIPESPRCCSHCMRLIDGRVFPADAIKGTTNIGKKQKDWGASVPLHPNCLHFAIPASEWLVERARVKAGGEIPNKGVRVEYIPPSQRTTTGGS